MKKYLKISPGILMVLLLLWGCAQKIPDIESSPPPGETSSVTDTAEPSSAADTVEPSSVTDTVEPSSMTDSDEPSSSPSQEPGDTVLEIGGALYAYQSPNGTRDTFILDSYEPFILQDIPDHLNDWLQKYTTAAVVVSGTVSTGETYPAKIKVSDIRYADTDTVDIRQAFLQRMAAQGWKSVVGIPGLDFRFLLMTDPFHDYGRTEIPAEITYGKDGASAVLNYILDRGDEKIILPLVTYSLETEPGYQKSSDGPGQFESRQIREIYSEESPVYLYASYERYAWRYLTDDYTFDKRFRRAAKQNNDDVILSEEEMLSVLQAQANYTVADAVWIQLKALYTADDEGFEGFAKRCFLQTDRFLERTGKRSVWVAGYDDYSKKDTYNPLRPEEAEQPPALTLLCGENTAEARRLTYTWAGVEADADTALMAADPPVLALEPGSEGLNLELSFDKKPDRLSVRYWPEAWASRDPEKALEYEEQGIQAELTDTVFSVPADQAYRIEIYAAWPDDDGSCWYVFKTQPAQQKLPVSRMALTSSGATGLKENGAMIVSTPLDR